MRKCDKKLSAKYNLLKKFVKKENNDPKSLSNYEVNSKYIRFNIVLQLKNCSL